MNIAIEAAIIGALVGASIGGGVSYFVSRKTIKTSFEPIRLQERNKAATAFRNAFLPEFIFLKHNAMIDGGGSSGNLAEFLRAGYLNHLRALAVFRSYLPPEGKAGIDRAWRTYCYHPDHTETPWFEQYSCKPDGRQDIETNLKKVALERIEEILRFAEQK